jgi:hypothetical protein
MNSQMGRRWSGTAILTAFFFLIVALEVPVHADCPDETIKCYRINESYQTRDVFDPNFLVYVGNIKIGTCWSWSGFGCYPCRGRTAEHVVAACMNTYSYSYPTGPYSSYREFCKNSLYPKYRNCILIENVRDSNR